MKRELKKSVIYGLYALSFILLVGGIAILAQTTKNIARTGYQYVSKGMLDYEENIKVVNTKDIILRPYLDEDISVVKSFYDYLADSKSQENSLIYYENTYMQSSGVAYSNGTPFDVVSILSGTVSEVKEDITLGNIISISHENGLISVYQSVTDISVSEGEKVSSGQVIAKSSTSNISTELENHLYFELIKDGVCVNPEDYYGKNVSEIEG